MPLRKVLWSWLWMLAFQCPLLVPFMVTSTAKVAKPLADGDDVRVRFAVTT